MCGCVFLKFFSPSARGRRQLGEGLGGGLGRELDRARQS